jgi:G3E family GTPase
MAPAAAADPIPVTLLSGFLGAGKTTLLNRILSGASGLRFAVIENEFGTVNIDSQLIAKQNAGIIELTNGCLCCSVNADFVRGLLELRERRASGELAFDWILIESTGLADPGAVAQTFFAAEELRDTFLLDGVVVVVDAKHAMRQLDEHAVAQRQAGFADRLLISKSDLVTPEELEILAERLARINARASQHLLDHGRIEQELLLGIGGFTLTGSLFAAVDGDAASSRLRYRPLAAPAGGALPKMAQPHVDEIACFLLEAGEVDLDRVSTFIQDLIDRHGDDLLRYKGLLAVRDEVRKLVFQGVQRVAGFDYGETWAQSEERISRIVVIGRRLPEEVIRDGFKRCEAGEYRCADNIA